MKPLVPSLATVLLSTGIASAQTPFGMPHNPLGGANLAIYFNDF